MQAAQATQALGVELYFYVRCPTCGKVLGNLQEDYTKLIKAADEEVRDLIPRSLGYSSKMEEYDNAMAKRFNQVMKKLGIQRQCCMMRIKNPQQVPVANPNPIEGNIAISRHTPGIKRNPTVIQLTKRSRVPGTSNIMMTSVTGYEETMVPGTIQSIDIWEEKMLKELDITNKVNTITTQTMSSSQQVLSPSTFSGLVPTIESGTTIPLKKRPKLVNVKTVGSGTGSTLPDMMELENSRILTFDTIPGMLGDGSLGGEYRQDNLSVDSSDLMDIQNLTLSSQY